MTVTAATQEGLQYHPWSAARWKSCWPGTVCRTATPSRSGGETQTIADAMGDLVLMIPAGRGVHLPDHGGPVPKPAVALYRDVHHALAFTGGLLALWAAGQRSR